MKDPGPIWPKGVSPKPALRQAREAAARIVPSATAAKAGCDYDGNIIKAPFLDHIYLVKLPEVLVTDEKTSHPAPPEVELVLLHYLTNADGTPPAGIWITYRYAPDAMLFERRFDAMAVQPLLRAFGSDKESFRRAAESLGGTFMSRMGDSAYRFIMLPQIPMGVVLYLADEEMQASASILFDAAAPQYLCAEDLAFLGIYLGESLLKKAGKYGV
ncbi:MAG: DUF3786 domain-containing protein [Chloroflexi bacterium]|nr:DUF3786 domain-containing protein [Chloroflexota bacterium]